MLKLALLLLDLRDNLFEPFLFFMMTIVCLFERLLVPCRQLNSLALLRLDCSQHRGPLCNAQGHHFGHFCLLRLDLLVLPRIGLSILFP